MPVFQVRLSCSRSSLSGSLHAGRSWLVCMLTSASSIEARMRCVSGLTGTLSAGDMSSVRTSEYNRIRR